MYNLRRYPSRLAKKYNLLDNSSSKFFNSYNKPFRLLFFSKAKQV